MAKIRERDVIVERLFPSGMLQVSAVVGDHLMRRRYDDYTGEEAVSSFLDEANEILAKRIVNRPARRNPSHRRVDDDIRVSVYEEYYTQESLARSDVESVDTIRYRELCDFGEAQEIVRRYGTYDHPYEFDGETLSLRSADANNNWKDGSHTLVSVVVMFEDSNTAHRFVKWYNRLRTGEVR